MSYLTALVGMWCPSTEEDLYTPEELERIHKARAEEEERRRHLIENKDHFLSFARPEESSAGGASGVKLLRDKDGVLHFMNTKISSFHYQYCTTFCNEKRSLEVFNDEAYTGKDRSMMFATIMSYTTDKLNHNTYCIELNPADPMVPGLEQIDEFFAQVKKVFMTSMDTPPVLYFHPTSPAQVEVTKNRRLCLPVIQSSEIFGNIPYKVVVPGRIRNKLVSIFDKETYTEEELINWLNLRTTEEIVVIPSVPNDIPAVGGVICNEIIPPLCHVALLCQNRNSPCCYYQDATKQLHKVFGNVVNGFIASSGFCFDGRDDSLKAEADKVEPVKIESADTLTAQLIELNSFKASDSKIVGAKAAQLAKVDAIYKQPVFEGTFIVPFHHYNKHVNSNQVLKEQLNALLTTGRTADTIKSHVFDYNQLSSVMDKIEQAPIDSELVRHVIDKIIQNKWTSVILRSSTNAEDLAGFNGAGLYESIALFGDDVTNHEKVSQALKEIWASVWSPKAVKERQHYSIPHSKVMMAVLVQPCISDKMTDLKVLLNGVCITHDASRHKVKNGFVVQVFPGSEYRVTNHYKDAVPESVTLLLGRQKDSVDMLLNSLCNKSSGSLLTQPDALNMTEVFGKLHNMMLGSPHSLNSTTALDIEFMIVNNKATNINRELVVLQARPYQVNVSAADFERGLQNLYSAFYAGSQQPDFCSFKYL